MTEIMQTVDSIIEVLDKFERPIEIALVVVLYMLSRKVDKNTAAMSPAPSATMPVVDIKAQKAAEKAEEKAKAQRQKDLQAEMNKALEVYFSGKATDEMTEEEYTLYKRAVRYFEEV